MVIKGLKMTLYPGKESEYKQRHNPIWKELEKVLKTHGVFNYNIFYDNQSHSLFCYVEVESEKKWEAISQTKICKKWWNYMKDIMETNADNSPVTKELPCLFRLT